MKITVDEQVEITVKKKADGQEIDYSQARNLADAHAAEHYPYLMHQSGDEIETLYSITFIYSE